MVKLLELITNNMAAAAVLEYLEKNLSVCVCLITYSQLDSEKFVSRQLFYPACAFAFVYNKVLHFSVGK